jgi:hypothetical protein
VIIVMGVAIAASIAFWRRGNIELQFESFVERYGTRAVRFRLHNATNEAYAAPKNDANWPAAFSRVKLEDGWEEKGRPLPLPDHRRKVSPAFYSRPELILFQPGDAFHFSVPHPERDGAVTTRPFQIGIQLRRLKDGEVKLVWSEVVTP